MGMLDGKVAIVTGGGQGIGRGIVRRFACEGAALVIAEMSDEHGRAAMEEVVGQGGRAVYIKTDVSSKPDVLDAVDTAVREFGAIDILVNNAGTAPVQTTLEHKTDAMLEHTLAVGVWGAWWAMQAALPHMRKQGSGRIINFVSVDRTTGAWLHSDYCIAKSGVEGLTRAAAIDWARYNILVNAVAPIAASAAMQKILATRPEFEAQASASVPLGRLGSPEEDIAPAVLFLASDMGRYVTGVTLPVDGGFYLQPAPTRPADLSQFD